MIALRAIPDPKAIVVAETFGVPLYKYTDSTERARSRLSIEEARSIGKQASKLIHVVQAPPALIDYVLVHELAHLQHRAHDRAFWSEVERCLPDSMTAAAGCAN